MAATVAYTCVAYIFLQICPPRAATSHFASAKTASDFFRLVFRNDDTIMQRPRGAFVICYRDKTIRVKALDS